MESNDQLSVDGLTEDSELSDVQASKRTKTNLTRITNFNGTMVYCFTTSICLFRI